MPQGFFNRRLGFLKRHASYTTVNDSEDGLLAGEDEAEQSPEEQAGFWSWVYFSWLNPIISLGRERPLEQEDLPEMAAGDRAPLHARRFEQHWQKEIDAAENREPTAWRLLMAIHRSFGREYYPAAYLKICGDGLSFMGPLFLSLIVKYLQDKDAPRYQGYLYALGLFVCQIFFSFCANRYFHVVYRASMQLSNSARQGSSAGEIVNLMSNDTQRLMDVTGGGQNLHLLWAGPLQVMAAIVYLYTIIGPSAMAGVGVLLLLLPINAVMARLLARLRKQILKFTDQRIKWIGEILQGIKVIKLYAWESSFKDRVNVLREGEMKLLKTVSFVSATNVFIYFVTPLLVAVATFTTYGLMGNELAPQQAFTALALLNILRIPLAFLPQVVNNTAEAWVSVKRLAAFLSKPEMSARQNTMPDEKADLAIYIADGTFCWDQTQAATALRGIQLSIKRGSLTAVVGFVGSGKSALLSAVLGEMDKTAGEVYVSGTIAYVAQQAWVMNASLRDNVLFGRPYDENKYRSVIEACALLPDLAVLPAGDMTEIGEKGINLSGGQKQRVALARAVYSDADVYILDDPLAAVDAHVGKHIFESCIDGILKGKTRLLATHNLQYLPHANAIITMKDGSIVQHGSYAELMSVGGVFGDLMRHFAHGNEHTYVDTCTHINTHTRNKIEYQMNPCK